MATVHVGANADPHTEHHCGRSHPSATERIRAGDDASEQRQVGAAGELGLAVDVAQNAADACPNVPSDNAVVSRA